MTKDKVRGMMLGVAIGDALGMPFETMTREEINQVNVAFPYTRPDGHRWFDGRNAGTWTDDTQLTLAVAESLIAKKCIDMDDMAQRHAESLQKEGDLGFDKSTRESIKRILAGVHWSESGEPHGYGNGVAMKVAPVAVYFNANYAKNAYAQDYLDPYEMYSKISQLAAMTHRSHLGIESALSQITAVGFCLYFKRDNFSGERFLNQIKNTSSMHKDKNILFSLSTANDHTLTNRWIAMQNLPGIENIPVENKFKMFGGANSFVYNSLPFSYSMFLENPANIRSLYNTIYAGGDTDTNGSIVGALLGALNGTNIFPQKLIDSLWQKDRILNTADRLCDAFGIKE